MQRKTLGSAKKDEDIRDLLTVFKDVNVIFVYTYRAAKFFVETIENDRPKFIIPTAASNWSTDDLLVAEEGLFEEYYIQHYETRKR